MTKLMYDLWVWDPPSWHVQSSYRTSREAHDAGKRSCDPPSTWIVVKVGSQKDEHMRANCTDNDAPYT